jgi:hypothetical protein
LPVQQVLAVQTQSLVHRGGFVVVQMIGPWQSAEVLQVLAQLIWLSQTQANSSSVEVTQSPALPRQVRR